MKAKINYKSRKTIIIIAIAVILVIAAIAGTVAFIKGNNNAAAAMPEDEQTTIGDAQNNNGGDANQNDGNPSENPSDNPQTELPAVDANNNGTTTAGNDGTVTGNNDTTGTTNGGTTTNGNGTGTTTGTTTGTAGTGATVPNQDYTQTTTVITENPWETKTIGWSPLSISAYTAAANLGINKPELSTEKLAYVQGDSLTEAPVHTAIQKGEVITYVIKVTNKGNLDATSIRTIDTVPEGTELVEGSITANGTESNGKITWKTDIKAGKPVELSFQVKVVADSIDIIENTAKVNGTETPTTQNPVITSDKQASVVIVKGVEEALEDRNAKVGETIRYTITAINKSEVDGTTIITDKVPEGTTYVADSASEGAVVADDGTITWEKVTVPAGEEVTVSFDVTVNQDTKTSVTNVAIVGDTETPETETKVANITTTKSSVGIRNGQQLEQGATLHEFDVIEYTLTATNSGNGEGSVVISDEVPEGTTLVPGSIKLDGTGSYDEDDLNNGITVLVGTSPRSVTFKVTVNKLTEAEVHIKNEVAKQDGKTITPGTDDKVEKEYVTVTANKDFVDNNGVDGKRPASVELELYEDGKTTGKTATTDANWKVEFKQLDKYTEAGELIKYSVKENNVNEYYEDTYSTPVVEENHTTIKVTNTLKYEMITRSVEATKVWDDGDNKAGVRPDSVEFELYADNATTNKTQTVSKVEDSNEWKTTFEGVNKYTSAGKEIVYSVKETTTPAHYNKQENGLTVTNKIDYTSIPTKETATKSWDDADNANRPSEVVIGAYNGSETPVKTAKANAGNNWTATFEGLQKYTAEGKKIEYTFKEVTVPEGYVATVKDNVITNALPRIEVTKTVKSINGEDATTVNSSTVKENDIIEYQITVKNTGSVTVNNITVTESLNVYLDANKPDEKTTSVGTISELKANEPQTFTVYYKVVAEDVDNVKEDLVNRVTATGKYTDGNGKEKEVTDNGEISVTPTEINDLSITKSQKVNEKDVTTYTKVVPEDVITYTIIVKNTGNTVLNNVEVTDSMLTNSNFVLTDNGGFTLENGKLKIASLALNETKTITAKYTVQESDMSTTVGTIANTATAKSDKAPEESSEVEVPTEAWYADISTTKTSVGSASPLHELDTITYTLTATNNGTDDGTVKLSDTVPKGTTLVKNSIKIGNTTYTETQLNNGIEVHLDAGETKKLTFSVTINPFETETIYIVNNTATQDGTPIPGTTDKVEKEYTSVTVNKTWVDNATQAQRRPDKIRFELYADGNYKDKFDMNTTKSEDSHTFDKLSKYNSNGTPITYTIQEKEINTGDLKFYTSDNPTVDANGKTYSFTNTFTKPTDTTKITVTKIWDDNKNAPVEGENGPRPTTPITIVFKGGENDIEKTLGGTGDTWTQSYDLPKYDSNGNEITYTVDEKTVPAWYVKSSVETTTDSTTKIPTTTITNSIPRIEVTKKIVTLNGAILTNTVAAVAGDVIGYEITVENIGSIDLTNVTVVDEMTNGKDVYANYNTEKKELSGKLVDGVVANINKLAVNSGKQTYTVYYKVDVDDVKNISDASSSTIDNTVTATGKYTDGTNTVRTVEDFDEESAGIKASSIISIEKTQKAGTVELDENGKDEAGNIVKVTPGTVMTYTIKVSNEGNTLQENVVVTDIMTINGNARTFTITSVKVEGKDRTYTTENGTISIGNLAVGEEAIITATYTVQETTDMAIDSQNIINHVSVVSDSNNDSNNPIEDEVKVPTEAWAPIITVSKSGKLANGKDANGNAAEYGNTITYTLKAENDGNATGTQILKDSDLENLLNSNKVSNVENIVVNNFDNAGNSIKDESKTVRDIISGITVNVPAGKTASVTFTVTVTACPDSDNPISNSVEGGTTPVETPVVKTINAKSNTGKVSGANYVLIIDTSSSMTSNYVDKENETTRFKAAKEAISDLATFLFAKDSETTSKISIVQFNREEDTKIVSVGDQIVFGVEDYKNGNITQLIENIKTHSGTNIEAGLKKAGDLLYDNKTGIHKQGLTTNSKDVLILLSDGSPYQGELEPYKLGKIARKQLNRKGEGITNDIYSIAFGTSESKDTLQAISPNKVYLSSNKEDLFKTFKDIVYEAGDSTPVTLTKASQVIYTGNKEIADDKEITITYDGLKAPLTYKFTAPGTSEDGVLTYAVKDGTYTLTFNLTAALLDKENILITYYVK